MTGQPPSMATSEKVLYFASDAHRKLDALEELAGAVEALMTAKSPKEALLARVLLRDTWKKFKGVG